MGNSDYRTVEIHISRRYNGGKMKDISLSYEMILSLELYMENEIKECRQNYNDLSWKYQESCKYKNDMEVSGSIDYGIDKEYYDSYSKSLQIRQYETFLKLQKLIKTCRGQNDGKGYISYTNGLNRELIRFNPSYDNASEMLERLKAL